MALDFPSSPTVGQVFGSWQWDGTTWSSLPSGGPFLPLAGGTIDPGPLNVHGPLAASNAGINYGGTDAFAFTWNDIVGGPINTWVNGNLRGTLGPAGQLQGTSAADNAAAGNVGEYIQANVAQGAALPLTSGANINVTQFNLAPGDWDVSGQVYYHPPAGNATFNAIYVGVSTTSGAMPVVGSNGFNFIFAPLATGVEQTIITGLVRFSLNVTTPIYLVAQGIFGTGPLSAYGIMRARRVR